MHHGRRAGRGQTRLQPVCYFDEPWQRTGARQGEVELPAPAAHLAFEVALRLAEIGQPGGLPVDAVDLDQRIDHLFADAAALGGRVELGRQLLADHDAVHPLHHVERRADHVHVFAQQQRLRHPRGRAVQSGEHAVLTPDVVGAGQQRAAGRAAHHPLLRAAFEVERLVGVAGRVLMHDEWRLGVRSGQRPAQIHLELRYIDQPGQRFGLVHRLPPAQMPRACRAAAPRASEGSLGRGRRRCTEQIVEREHQLREGERRDGMATPDGEYIVIVSFAR